MPAGLTLALAALVLPGGAALAVESTSSANTPGLAPPPPPPASTAAPVVAAVSYSRLKALYNERKYQEVLKVASKQLAAMKQGEPDYARIAVLSSLVSLKLEPIINAASLAREAYQADQGKNLLPAANYGLMEIVVGDRALAFAVLQKAAQIAPDDFLTHLGLAELYAGDPKYDLAAAHAELSRAEAASGTYGLSQQEKWRLIGDDCMVLDEPGRALKAYLNAVKNGGDESGRLAQSIFCAAMESGDEKLGRDRLEAALAGRATSGDALVLAAQKFCPETAEGNALAKRIYDTAMAKFADEHLLYRLGRAFGTAGQGRYARLCYEKALQMSPNDDNCAIAYAGQLSRSGNNVLARRELAKLARKLKLGEPTSSKALVQGLTMAGLKLLDAYDSDWANSMRTTLRASAHPHYKTAYADLQKIKCHCRFLSMQLTLRRQPGVVFGYIPNNKIPRAAIVYDPKVTQPQPVFAKLNNEAVVTPLAGEENVPDFASLVQFALDYSEAKVHPDKPSYNFNPLPARLMD